jgi:hypothetical protein
MKTVTRDQVGHEELALPLRVQEALGRARRGRGCWR